MSKEAMKLARLAINNLIASSHATDPQRWRDARQDAVIALTAIDKAPAEQPAQKRPQNCGTGYCSCIECVMEPAQQEPVAWMRQDGQRVVTANDRSNYPDYKTRYSVPLYTPQAPKENT